MPYMSMTVMTDHSIIESNRHTTHTHTETRQYTQKHINIMLVEMADKPHFLSESEFLSEMAV